MKPRLAVEAGLAGKPTLALRSGLTLAALALFAPWASAQEAPGSSVGDIFVANIREHHVSRFDGATGAFKSFFVQAGSGGLTGPTGIAFGPDGNLYVGSSQTNQVLRYHGDSGAFLGAFVDDPELQLPFSLIFGPDGHLYVSSGMGNQVRRYDGGSGAFAGVAAADSTLLQPIGLRFGPGGMLYVVSSRNRRILRFDPSSGRLQGTFASDSMRFPSDLIFGPGGDVYVSNAANGTVVRFDGSTGSFAGVAAQLPEGGGPVGLDFDSRGRLVIADFVASRLFRLDPADGSLELLSVEGLAGPENLVVKPKRPDGGL